MKKLLWKEWIYAKWLIILSIFISLTTMLQTFSQYIEYVKVPGVENQYANIDYSYIHYFCIWGQYTLINIILIFFSVFVIMAVDSINKQYEMLNAMPYSRNQIILSKWIMAIVVTIIPEIISYCAFTILYFTNYSKMSIYNNYSFTFMWMLISILSHIFLVTFIMFIQSLFGNNVAGTIVSILILFFWAAGGELIDTVLGIYKISTHVRRDFLLVPFYNTVERYNPLLKIYVLIIFILIFFTIMIKLFKRAPLENMGNLNLYKAAGLVIRIFIVVNIAMVIVAITSDQFLRENSRMSTLVGIISVVILYYAYGKIIKRVNGEN
ncbi:ABC transporter permease family protein [Clostridium hydrogenum]|uniref:hypothetical protein n=1 Tax=Clostridium hydrogenum TaxID=2855764 RepID=UPI001F236B68|nr:hypothetical protein [Clostridium hydrogenum]